MTHFVLMCRDCKVVMAQCRCPDANKRVDFTQCRKCADQDKRLAAFNQQLDDNDKCNG